MILLLLNKTSNYLSPIPCYQKLILNKSNQKVLVVWISADSSNKVADKHICKQISTFLTPPANSPGKYRTQTWEFQGEQNRTSLPFFNSGMRFYRFSQTTMLQNMRLLPDNKDFVKDQQDLDSRK